MMIAASLFILFAVILLFGEIAAKPIKLLWKILLNSVLGLILLALFNYTAHVMHWMSLPINVITVLIAGFLGIPGMILLLVFRLLLSN